jgi:hypothetical protein
MFFSDLKKNNYIGYFLCVVFFGLVTMSFYPGMMSPDSVTNLTDGRNNVFYDLNSPVMSFLWGKLDKIIEGPALMFLLQNSLFWGGCAIFWLTAKKRSFKLGIALILFALLPHILSQLTTVWKDVAMGTSLFLTVALIYHAKVFNSKISLLLSPLFLFYGYAARLNALPAVLPIAIWSDFIACQIFEIGKTKFAPVFIGIGYFFLLSTAVYVAIYTLTEWKTIYPFQQNYLYDLAAISKDKDEALFPGYILSSENFSLEGVKSRYNERSVNDLIYKDIPKSGDKPILDLTLQPEQIDELQLKWREMVLENPLSYLKHRLIVFAQLVGLKKSTTRPYWDVGFASSPPEFRGNENVGFKVLMKYFSAFRRPFSQTFFFRAFIWLLLCLYLSYQSVKRKLKNDWDIVFVLSSSCLLFTSAYFPTTPSTEFRYLFWSAISSSVALIFGIYLLRKEKTKIVINKTD